MLTCVLRRLCLLQPTRSSLKDTYRTRTRATWREPGLASNWKTADFQRIVHFKTRFHPLAFLVSINTEAADLLPSSHDPVPPASKHYPEVISSNETQRFQDHFNSIQMPHSPERGYRQSHFQSRPTMAFETSCNQSGRSRTRGLPLTGNKSLPLDGSFGLWHSGPGRAWTELGLRDLDPVT